MKQKKTFNRKTKETNIKGSFNLKGSGRAKIESGVGFMDHMLELLAFHSGFDLELVCKGDLNVDPHHSIEDIAIIIGETFDELLGDRKGILRYATCFLPMDESLTRTVVDLSGRPYHIFRGDFQSENLGGFPTGMVKHFFYSFSMRSKITLHQEIIYGENDHHKIESLFKGLAKSLARASMVVSDAIPSSKGIL